MDTRANLFSFGAVLYEMATGRLPFPGNTAAVVHEAILNKAPAPAARLNKQVPAELEEVISIALEKDRKLRYQKATDIRADLQRLRQESTEHVTGALPAKQGGSSNGWRRDAGDSALRHSGRSPLSAWVFAITRGGRRL